MKAVTIKLDEKGLEALLRRIRAAQELGFENFDFTIENPQAPLGRFVKAFTDHRVKLCAVRLAEPRQKAVVFRRPGYAKMGALSKEISEGSARMVLDTAEQLAPAKPNHLVLTGGYVDFPTLVERQIQLDEHLDREERNSPLPKDLLQTPEAKADDQLENLCRALHGLSTKLSGLAICLMPPSSPFGLLTPERMQHVFEDLREKNLGYWHSTSNAALLEKLGIVKQDVWLAKFAQRLKGVYLADNLGAHGEQAPGLGEIDFGKLAPELAKSTIRVLVTDDASGTKMRFGADYLAKVGIF